MADAATHIEPLSRLIPNSAVVSPHAGADSRREVDAALIRAAQSGDRDAFELVVSHYDQAIHRLARSIVRSEADAWDVYQETFIKVYRSLGRFRFECSFYTWVYRIAVNSCLDYLRRQTARRETQATFADAAGEMQDLTEQIADATPVANPEQLLLSRELQRRIDLALRRLTPRERIVFELKHYHGLKLRTIGEILDTTEETAKNSLFRGTQKLRTALADLIRREPGAPVQRAHAASGESS
jgi:RNA polymerase sigma-70 factor (ECF subfamily)